MPDRVKLYYDPIFTPGDILQIEGYDRCGIVTGTRDAGVIEDIFEGKPQRMFMVLFWDENAGFACDEFPERYLKEKAERKGHVHYGDMTCNGTDVAEVLFENRTLKERLGNAIGAVEYFRNLAGKGGDGDA